ncbi:MAG: hypothetical protein ACO2O2_11600 [Acidilobaceae archaeon]|jgi:hypothetical protein
MEEDIRQLEEDIRQLIEKYNKEEPKNPDADPETLILAESPFTYSVELHLGNITMAVLEGGWGTGKTSSALLLFHKLKRRTPHLYVSYIPCREAMKIVEPEVRVKVNGTSSPSYLATLIVLSLIKPLSLASGFNKLSGPEYVFMTTLKKDLDLSVDIMNEDALTLIEKIAGYYASKGMKHVLLLDELERCLVSQEDVFLLGKLPETLRGLSDRHGSSPIVMILFAIDQIPADTAITQYVGRSIGTYITSTIRRNLGPGASYVLDKMIMDKAKLTESLLHEIVKKSVMMVAKHRNVEPDLLEPTEVGPVLRELTSMTYHIRFSSDLLILSLASSFVKALREKSRQNLREHFDNIISRIISGIDPDVVRRALVRGDFTIIEDIVGRDVILYNLSRYIGEVMREVGGEMGARPLLVGERRDRGFLSLTYNVALTTPSRRGEVEVVVKPLVFWLRYTSITEETVRKANKVFYRSNVVILSAEKIRHHLGLTLPREFNIIDIAYIPHDVLFFLVVGSDRINDLKLRGALETKTYEILKSVVGGALDRLKQR